MPATVKRWVVTPNNDTIYGAGFANLGVEPAVIQTPAKVPKGHYWTIQIVDVFTNVIHQLGSASSTPSGKFLLVGPDWKGEKPEGFLDILHMPTNVAGVFPNGQIQLIASCVRLDEVALCPIGLGGG